MSSETRVPGDRGALLGSAGLYALLVLAGIWWFSYRLYDFVLLFAALFHLHIVVRRYPKIDRFFLLVHYGLLVLSITSVFVYVFRFFGLVPHAIETLLIFVREELTTTGRLGFLALFLLLYSLVTLLPVALFEWFASRSRPRVAALSAGLFAASILLFACDYAFYDPLSKVGATRPEESRHFLFAAGMIPLLNPLVFHGLLVAALAVARKQRV